MSNLDDDDSFPARMRRYARVTGSMGSVAARVAGNRFLGRTADRAAMAAELREALGGLKGPLMKVAQIMSTIPDALPREFTAELGQLQAHAPAMGWLFVKRRMATELGPDWQTRFKAFSHEAARAASLGQVHKATAHDGRELACKLQYPDMASAVEADLGQLNLIFRIFRRYDSSIDPAHIEAEIAARLREELDYLRERKHTALYRRMLADEPDVHVPAPLPELSTRRLLTMTWLEGRPLMDFRDADQETRNQLAYNLFRAWYVPLHHYGIIHGDPHLGNYTVRPDLSLNLLDFGCIRVFPPRFISGVIDLYRALERHDRDLAVHAYETWGFHNLSAEVIDTLNMWAEFVYAPVLDNRRRPIQDMGDMSGGAYGRDVAEKVHARLRELGPVTPPREFVFMDRAAIGLGGVFMHLKAEINWHEIFEDLIKDFSHDTMARRQQEALDAVGLESRDAPAPAT